MSFSKYERLCHAMQSGVAALLGRDPQLKECTPKHLRVGVNAAMSDHGALVKLLIEKGVITEAEYIPKLEEFMQREVDSYTKRCSDEFGKPITLG